MSVLRASTVNLDFSPVVSSQSCIWQQRPYLRSNPRTRPIATRTPGSRAAANVVLPLRHQLRDFLSASCGCADERRSRGSHSAHPTAVRHARSSSLSPKFARCTHQSSLSSFTRNFLCAPVRTPHESRGSEHDATKLAFRPYSVPFASLRSDSPRPCLSIAGQYDRRLYCSSASVRNPFSILQVSVHRRLLHALACRTERALISHPTVLGVSSGCVPLPTQSTEPRSHWYNAAQISACMTHCGHHALLSSGRLTHSTELVPKALTQRIAYRYVQVCTKSTT